ncbi:MAG: phage portal protein, partial [Pseudomonadota bacterium]
MAQSVQILNARGEPLSVAQRTAAQRVAAMNVARSTAYQAAGFGHPSTRNWFAPRVSGQSAASQSRDVLTARTRDMVRNDSAMAAGLDKKVNNVVGGGLRLDADPNFEALGIAPEYREAIITRIEMLWDEFANDHGAWIDAERNGNLADLLLLWAHHLEADGECFLILPWRDEPSPTGFQTCVQTVHPARCSNPLGIMDRADLREGVALDAMGAAIGYHFRRAHPGDTFLRGKNQFQWDYFERDHDDGRPYVLHAFDRNEAGVYRAISKLWSVLRKQMQGEQYFDSELQAAQLNAIMALFIETPFDQMELLDSMSPDKFAEHMSA